MKYRIIAVAACVVCWAQAAAAGPVVIVKAGKGGAVHVVGKAWRSVDGALVGGGKPNRLHANVAIGKGDFRITARLRMADQKNSAAAFFLGDNYFGFEGAGGTVYLNGRIFGGKRMLKPSPDYFDRGSWIDFEAIRASGRIRFLINGKEAVSASSDAAFEPVGFSPARSTMHIRHFSVEGNLHAVEPAMPRGYTIPLVDLAGQKHRQVVVDREAGQYLGHVTTVLLEDNKTMIAVYPKGHGRGAIVMKRSTDAGKTWSKRLPVPESWATSKEVPTIHRVVDAKGVKRLIVFSGLYPARLAVSEDDGGTWSELKPLGDWGGIVVMGDVIALKAKGCYMAMFHDDGRFFTKNAKRYSPRKMIVYKTFSTDGGLTWSFPDKMFERSDVGLCEPGMVRSPDGKQIAVLFRENYRVRNSHMILSNDEGKTWTDPVELPGAMTGDRHTIRYAPDGRLVWTARDTCLDSPTQGDWIAWVGKYEDIVKGRQGQYRIRLMENHKSKDCAYPGMEVLPDGTFVATTYGHWTPGEQPYIVSLRFTLAEIDKLARAQAERTKRPKGITIPTLDVSDQAERRVIVDREKGRYLGQPDTVLMADGKTIFAAYPGGHGGPDTMLKRSDDGGKTWSERLPVPESFTGKHNAPTLHRVTDTKGVERLILIVSHPVMKQSVSADSGRTWTPLKAMFSDKLRGKPGYKGHAPPKSVARLTDGRYLAMYHDHLSEKPRAIGLFQTISADGGLTWSAPARVGAHTRYPGAHPCEPGIIRSKDGKELLCLIRENSRQYNSLMMVSSNEGRTWSDMVELPGSLTGDRHLPRFAPDGRLVVPIRDMNKTSSTYGDFILWVGTYEDILAGRPGQYRVRLLDNQGPGGDTGYSGLVLLPDGTFVSTTYCRLAKKSQPVVVSLRFTLAEFDELARRNQPTQADVFRQGVADDGYPRIRIPAVCVTGKGTVLAFAEGRQGGDHSENDIIMKRSGDGGRTWGKVQVVDERGKMCLNNPMPVVLGEMGRILLIYQVFPEDRHGRAMGKHVKLASPGLDGPGVQKCYLTGSDDDGKTWSKPRDITAMVKRPTKIESFASGPGVAVVLRRGKYKGRILAPFNESWHEEGKRHFAVYTAYSDDVGKTWKMGASAANGGKGYGNEVQVVELADGSVLLNSRSAGGSGLRKTAVSTDGGQTFSPLKDAKALIEPQCQGSILRYTDPLDGLKSRLIFSNPASRSDRRNGTIRLSYDEGKTWPVAKTLYSGGYAYSCLTVLGDGTIGCLFERDGYKRITFARFNLTWLTDGRDKISTASDTAHPTGRKGKTR